MIVVDANWSLNTQSLKTEQFLLSRLHDIHIPATLVFNKVSYMPSQSASNLPLLIRWTLLVMI